jgi:adenylate kinase
MGKMNAWSGGSMSLHSVKITDVDTSHVELAVQVEKRGKASNADTVVSFPLDTNVLTGRAKYMDLPIVVYDDDRLPIDDIVRRLNRLCWMVQDEHVTGKLVQLALQLGGAGIGKIPDSLYLNQVPHNVYVRNYFYTSASKAVKDAVIACSQGKMTSNRMQVISQFPEMNPSMDSYRIGTILEMCRDMCITLAEENVRGTYVRYYYTLYLCICAYGKLIK